MRQHIGTGQPAPVSGRPSRPISETPVRGRTREGVRRVEDLAQTHGAWAGLGRRGGQGRVMRSDLPSGLQDPRHRACGRSHPSRRGWKRAAASPPWPPVRPRSCARSGSRASPWSDTTAAAASRTGWRATIWLPGSGLRCSTLCGLRPWLRALTTSLIEAQRLGPILCRAPLRGRRLRGADRRRASLGKADLSEADRLRADVRGADLSGADLRETDLGTADLTDCCGAHHARRGQGISKEGYGAGLAVSE
jgi:hypothetical protein